MPQTSRFCSSGNATERYTAHVSPRPKRYYGGGELHFVTFSCYGRKPSLRDPATCDLFLEVLESTRRQYRFVVIGYVVMPEHVHLLVSEPQRADLSTALKALKQAVSRRAGAVSSHGTFWYPRFYDLNVWSDKKRIEKLRYIHRNPVRRGLVASPEEWRWSSFRSYSLGEKGAVDVKVVLPPEWAVRTDE